MTYLLGINSLISSYEAFFIDLWGVVHDGISAYPGVVDCLNHLISLPKKVLFVSNSPRPGELNYLKLKDLGVNLTPEMMLTSGDLLRLHMKTADGPLFKKLGPAFYHAGSERNHDLLSQLPLTPVASIEEADFVLFSAYADPEENIHAYDSFLEKILALNLPLVCANPDQIAIHGTKLRHCAGYFAHLYEKMGGQVYFYGKPQPLIFTTALDLMASQGIKDKSKILMVGDTIETDILGASQSGLHSALTLSGNAGRALKSSPHSPAFQRELHSLCHPYEVTPHWVLPSLILGG
jgi:HAD superfamily hydrolase (TIGR01459 family)